MGPRPGGETLVCESVTCARCGRKVGLMWYRGHSTLFEGPIDTDGRGNLVVARHACEPRPPGSEPGPVRRNERNGRRSG